MNTDDEPPQAPLPDQARLPATKPIGEVLSRGVDALPPLPVDESAAALELRLQKVLDERQEERFYGVLVATVLIDMIVFEHLSWIGIICIFLLELVILTGLARKLGSEHVTILLDYLFHQFCEKIGLGGPKG